MSLLHTIGKIIILAGITTTSIVASNNPARAEERACVMTKDGKTVCGKLLSSKNEPDNSSPISNFQKDKKGHPFLLKGCRRASNNKNFVECTFIITTRKENDSVMLRSNSIVDSTGKSYGGWAVAVNTGNIDKLEMSPGIEYFADFGFNNIPEQVDRVSFLNIKVDNQTLQFRNIPISE
jgi:hypothetical protein